MVEINHRNTGEVLHRVEGDTLIGAHLARANLFFAHLTDADLTDADLTDADLRGADLTDADLSGADLTGARLNTASLTGANLRGADLTDADLTSAQFTHADLSGADLTDARLTDANLTGARLTDANLTGANLSNADLTGACLPGAQLVAANLSHAILFDANLAGADLTGANLTGVAHHDASLREARFGGTVFAFCWGLHTVHGLESVRHVGPSALDASTLRASIHQLPDVFLRGVGYSQEEIQKVRAVYAQASYYSCFISYAHGDRAFAERLHNDLQAQGVVCWLYGHAIQDDKFLEPQIYQVLHLREKRIVVCSEASLQSEWLPREITNPREWEGQSRRLFAVRLDDFLLSPQMLALADRQMAAGACDDWVRPLRAMYVPDFSDWEEPGTYEREFQKLLLDLKNPAPR